MADLVALRKQSLEHELVAHRAVLSSLATVPDGRRGEGDWRKALDLYAHIVAARQNWLARIRGGTDEKSDWFPSGSAEAELGPRSEEVLRAWLEYLAELTEPDLERWFQYTSWEGGTFENKIDDVFQQLEGHSHYHRGQIAALVRRLGGQPAATDLIPRVRRPVSKP